MIDFHQLFSGLTKVISDADFPDAAAIAAALDLDTSGSSIMKTKSNSMCINTARLNLTAVEVGIACGVAPRREIWLLFLNSPILYQNIKDEVFGSNQRVVPSKRSAGFAVLFEIDGWRGVGRSWFPA